MKIELAEWQPVKRYHLVAVVCFAALIVLLRDSSGWTPLLDSANLAFHEAGHLVYGIFGDTMGLYGGVVGQLTFPALATGVFFVRRLPASTATTAIWFFQNFFNIARYMADARAQELPLVGGGEHDFTAIFLRWHVFASDTKIARTVEILGWFGIVGCLLWLAWRHRLSSAAA